MKSLYTGLLALSLFSASATAAHYVIDDDEKGAHAAVNFKIKHLGYSWLTGRFNRFEGHFNYEPGKLEDSSVKVTIDTTSVDSNHARRDKHLRGDDFLSVDKFPKATFISNRIETINEEEFKIHGKLTLHGVTKDVVIDATKIGEGKDPWGGYRAGFTGTTELALKDFGIDYNLGPASTHVQLELHVEGIRQD
ncbi:YceI family protein [Catenovulum sediminis]|uniref:YceI family protein n=1 Tax=Catenovulum sediminis TaxID=1740262 RepID=A0ABV1RKS4_9ALTE|nr:YceI family protein [Catenovulum sediminis]